MLFCRHYFSPINTFMRKGKDPDPHLWLIDPDPRGPKPCGFGSDSGLGQSTDLHLYRQQDPDPLVWGMGPRIWIRTIFPLSHIIFYVVLFHQFSRKKGSLECLIRRIIFLCAVYCWGPADQVQDPCQWSVRQRRLRQDPGLVEGEVRNLIHQSIFPT